MKVNLKKIIAQEILFLSLMAVVFVSLRAFTYFYEKRQRTIISDNRAMIQELMNSEPKFDPTKPYKILDKQNDSDPLGILNPTDSNVTMENVDPPKGAKLKDESITTPDPLLIELNRNEKIKPKIDSLNKINSIIELRIESKGHEWESTILIWVAIFLFPLRYWIFLLLWAIRTIRSYPSI